MESKRRRKGCYIGRVDVTFRGIALPPGEHEIVFWYRPFSLVLGESVSTAAFVAVCILFWFWTKVIRSDAVGRGRVQSYAATH